MPPERLSSTLSALLTGQELDVFESKDKAKVSDE